MNRGSRRGSATFSFAGRIMRCLIVLVVAALAPDVTRAAGPVCALLEVEKHPRAAVLEAKLLSDSSATWVERTNIDAVLKEQKLQVAFGPQGVGERVKLGRLLKADVLVLVRSVKEAKEPALEVVVSETAGGLRLLVRAVPLTKDSDADVQALVSAVREGIQKHGEAIKEVVAVPPFVSNNLSYEFDYLKGAFAKLTESVALARKGVVVVELEEAEALAKELALAAPGARINRPSPLYLVGEYRHEGRDKDRTVTLKLRTERAGKLVGKPESITVKPDAAADTLRKWAAGVLDTLGGAVVALPDPQAEAKRLGELAVVHQRLGDWPNALALIEASLLLEPKQAELNADAMAILRYWIDQTLRNRTDNTRLKRAAQLHRRGFAHMEALLASGAQLPRYKGFGVRPIRAFESSFPFPVRQDPLGIYPSPTIPPEERAIIEELEQERRETFRRVLPLAAKDGSRDEMEALVRGAVGILPAAEHYAEYTKLILKYQHSKGLIEAMNTLLATYPVVHTAEGYQVYRKFLDVLEKDGNADVREVVGRFRQTLPGNEKVILEMVAKRLADEEERKRRIEEAKKNPRPPASTIRFNATREELDKEIDEHQQGSPFRRVSLTAATPDDAWFIDQVRGVIPAGPRIDVFWATARFPHPKPGDAPNRPKVTTSGIKSGLALLVMKEKGVLKRVFAKPGLPEKVTDVCFDGKFVWVVAEESRKASALFVLDPVSEVVYEVTTADGLPEVPEEFAKDPRRSEALPLRVAALGPGRVCISGWFGRAWIGTATFDGDTKKAAVKVFHEAKEVPRQGEKEPWLNPKLTFVPEYVRVLRGKPDQNGKAPVRVLIGRGWSVSQIRVNDYLPQMGPYPLVVDPETGTVETVKDPIRVAGWQIAAHGGTLDGSIYVAYPPGGGGFTCNLYRIDYPGTVRDLGPLPIPQATSSNHCVAVGNRLYFAVLDIVGKPVPQPGGGTQNGSAWWTSDLDGKNAKKLADNTLRVRAIHHSSHYGVVAWCDLHDALPRWVCNEVLIDAPKK